MWRRTIDHRRVIPKILNRSAKSPLISSYQFITTDYLRCNKDNQFLEFIVFISLPKKFPNDGNPTKDRNLIVFKLLLVLAQSSNDDRAAVLD